MVLVNIPIEPDSIHGSLTFNSLLCCFSHVRSAKRETEFISTEEN